MVWAISFDSKQSGISGLLTCSAALDRLRGLLQRKRIDQFTPWIFSHML
jgi:hypothetical protein